MCPAKLSVSSFLHRLAQAVAENRVFVTGKAADEAVDDLGWTREDILLQLLDLVETDFERTEESTAHPGNLIWVFCPDLDFEGTLWIRLAERHGVVVISFHLG
ncbi:MAG: type II toxin-antitoxin system MqsR family toxin [Pseudomonadota bacterium]